MPTYLPPNSHSKTPVGHSQQIHSHQQSRLPSGNPNQNPNQSPSKNPYLVNNPMPSLDQMDRPYASYDYSAGPYGRPDLQSHRAMSHNIPNNQFNPNSFYNQHSQYKSNLIDSTPKKEVANERQANYGGFNPQQIAKKKFENLSSQNKQMRMAEEAVRGFESPNFSQRPIVNNNRYGEFNQPPPIFYNNDLAYNKPPQQLPFNGYREIHSNPAPHQHLENNAFGYYAGNIPNQYERRPQYEGSPNPGHHQGPPSSSPQGSKSENQSRTNFKPYNLKDYKDMKGNGPVKLGGLGANTNTDEWYKEKSKRDKMVEFSQNVKLFNMQRLPNTETSFKPRKDKEKEKEKSRREIALEFAKNVPKPKVRKNSPIEEEPMEDLYTKKSESDMIVDYGGTNDLDVYEQRHNFYAAQLQRIKNNY